MLPITARKKLRVPHHIAMACAAIAVLASLFMDVRNDAPPVTTAMSAQATEAKPTQQTRQQSPELKLPRLLPWRHWPDSL